MANKLISIGGGTVAPQDTTSEEAKIVYRDVSIDSINSTYVEFPLGSSKGNNVLSYKIDKLTNINAIKNSLKQIFTWTPGERILLPEFGTNLRRILYEGLTATNKELVAAEIRAGVTQWEPRVQIIKVVNVGTPADDDDNSVHLEIIYTIPSLSEELYNYSFYYRL